MAEIEQVFFLPLPGWPRALFTSDATYENSRLELDGEVLLQAARRQELESGVSGRTNSPSCPVVMSLDCRHPRRPVVRILVDGKAARREDELRPPPTRSAWTHAVLALAASAAGFAASYLYLVRASAGTSEWDLKMGNHMAGWHLLLTFTLFPASVWGRQTGIRCVQFVSLLFFLIHLGIAVANLGGDGDVLGHQGWIAFFNGLSGLSFLVATFYGNYAHRDMSPATALRAGRL